MKAKFIITKDLPFKNTNYIYLFNFPLSNTISYYSFTKSMDLKYINRKECVGVWKIKSTQSSE